MPISRTGETNRREMNDNTYQALFTGIVIGLTFGLVTFIVGFYAVK